MSIGRRPRAGHRARQPGRGGGVPAWLGNTRPAEHCGGLADRTGERSATTTTPASGTVMVAQDGPWSPANPPPDSEEHRAPSAVNAKRSAEAIRSFQEAQRLAGTPPVDFSSRVLQPLEVQEARDKGESLLEPGHIVQAAGEAIPALGYHETDGRRDAMVDTLERPTTVSVRASEHRLELLEKVGILQAGIDTANTARASNAVEKMLCHQLAATHSAVMNLLAYMPGVTPRPFSRAPSPSSAEIPKLANAAARLMAAYVAGCDVLLKMKRGGTQRVIVQHQQVVMAPDGQTLIVNNVPSKRRRGASRRRGEETKNGK